MKQRDNEPANKQKENQMKPFLTKSKDLGIPSEGRVCPWCEGRKVVGQLAHGEEPDFVTVLGQKIPIIGTMLEKRCKFCEGKGWLPKDLSQADRWAQIRAKREAAKRKEAG